MFLDTEQKNERFWTESQLWKHPYIPTKANGSVTNYGTIQQNVYTGKGKVVRAYAMKEYGRVELLTPLVLNFAHCLGVASRRFQRLRRLHNHWPWSGHYDMTLLVFYAWFLSGPVFLLLNSPYGFICFICSEGAPDHQNTPKQNSRRHQFPQRSTRSLRYHVQHVV